MAWQEPSQTQTDEIVRAIHHAAHLIADTLMEGFKHMAAIDDELAAIKASLDTIQSGVNSLLAKIAAMPTAGLTPAQQTALDAINTEAQAIAVAANPPAPAPAAPAAPAA